MVFQLIRLLEGRRDRHQYKEVTPHTAFYNTDMAHVSMGTVTPSLLKNHQNLPQFIYLKAKIVPLPLKDTSITMTYREQDQIYEGVSLYPVGEGYCGGMDIHYLGSGDYLDEQSQEYHSFTGVQTPWGDLHLTGTLLYHHSFVFQDQDFTATAFEKGQEVRGYAGYYRLGCPLAEIQQVFFTVGFEDKRSAFYLSPLSQWQQKGMTPPDSYSMGGQEINFTRCGQEEIHNLQSIFQQGMVHLPLMMGIDEEGQEVTITYQSIDILSPAPNQLLITYQRREL